jgi:Tfp pilus assembly protein PilF
MKDPAAAQRLYNMAVSQLAAGQPAQARTLCQQVLKLDKYNPNATHLLAILEFRDGRAESAVELAQRAIRYRATDQSYHHTLSIALRALGRFEEAEPAARQACQLAPRDPEEISELGLVLASLGRKDEARECYERALALAPDHPAPRMNYSALLLDGGEFERGWAYFESRPSLTHLHRAFAASGVPFWAGQDLKGKRILVHAEQGIGDTILFSRYSPMLQERGGSITLACHPRLVPLIRQTMCESIVVVPDTQPPYPATDFRAGLLSMPLRFGTTVQSVPDRCPYLQPDAAAVARWRERLQESSGLKVGLAWAGNPKYPQDRARSIDLSQLAPLLRQAGVSWYTLQMGTPAEQIKRTPEAASIIDLTPEQTDLAETAALMANLDLVISVDTAVANLAGALGLPTWVLLSGAADWRWNGEQPHLSRWYPAARLFRQSVGGQWSDVIARVAAALEKKTSGTE